MFRGTTSIVYKEAIHILRDPRTLFLMLLIPGLQLTVFGYAIDTDIENIPTVVYNLDGRQPSRDVIDAFVNTGYFDVRAHVGSDQALIGTIVRGDAQVGLKIPPDYTDRLLLAEPARVQVLIDGSDSNVAMQALNVSNAIAMERSLDVISERLGRGFEPPVESRPRMLFNPAMKTPNFMVPGLVGIIMQLVTMFLTAFAVVREKETGTLEQLMVTPVTRSGLMAGKLIPYAVIGSLETASVVLLMRYLFQVPITGSLILLAVFSLVFLVTTLGLGLMISTIARTQMEAMQWAFAAMLPSVLLSGFLFPQESMPRLIYWISQAIPVTHFIRILRGIILRGADHADLWQEGAILFVMAIALLMVSTARFRKTLS